MAKSGFSEWWQGSLRAVASRSPRRAALTAAAYVEMQQNAIHALNISLPILGLVCIVLTATLAVLTKNDKRGRYLLVASVICLATAGLVTRFGNQPINAVVMTWSPQAPAANWMELRDTWWNWHILRTMAGVAALVLALLAAVGSQRHSQSSMPRGRDDSRPPTSRK